MTMDDTTAKNRSPAMNATPAFTAEERLLQMLTGCPFHDIRARLKAYGLRPTKQRLSLGWLLFAKGDRHITAEILHSEAVRAKFPVSLATVYNTLHQFTQTGLLREISVDGNRTWFDTCAHEDHHHFFIEDEGRVVDMPHNAVVLGDLPKPPEGMEITKVEVIVRVRKKEPAGQDT